MKIIGVGEILWDVFEDSEHLGGAVFNMSAHTAQMGHETLFVSAVGQDERGQRALDRTAELGLDTGFIARTPEAPTGIVTVSVDAHGQPSYVIHRPAAYDFPALTEDQLGRLASPAPDWVCFGTLFQIYSRPRALTETVAAACRSARRFYDVNLRRDSYNAALVEELLGEADVVKLNEDEVLELGRLLNLPSKRPEEFARHSADRFGWQAVCVTRGAAGCSLLTGDEFIEAPGYQVKVADTVGAGDSFSAAFLHGLGAGWPPEKIADFANRVGAFVASRPGGVPQWTLADLPAPATNP